MSAKKAIFTLILSVLIWHLSIALLTYFHLLDDGLNLIILLLHIYGIPFIPIFLKFGKTKNKHLIYLTPFVILLYSLLFGIIDGNNWLTNINQLSPVIGISLIHTGVFLTCYFIGYIITIED